MDLLAERLELWAMRRVDLANVSPLLVAQTDSPKYGPAEPSTPTAVPARSSPPVGERDCAAEQH
jgi:hypothetical protein